MQTSATAVEALVEESFSLRYSNPRQSEAVAREGVSAAESLPVAPKNRDCQARAWGNLGNSLRLVGDFGGSRHAFARAWERARQGSGSRSIAAKIHEFEASLALAQHDPAAAALSLRSAVRLRSADGYSDVEEAGSALMMLALIEGEGDPERGLTHLREALVVLRGHEAEHPLLIWDLLHNSTKLLVDGGAIEAAVRLQVELLGAGIACDCPARLRKARWLQGRIASELGQHELAISELGRVRDDYASHEQPVECALVGLELAQAYATAGSLERAQEALAWVVPLLGTLALPREAEAAALLMVATESAASFVEGIPSLLASVRRDARMLA